MAKPRTAEDFFAAAIIDFTDYLHERSLADTTIDSYQRDLRGFAAFAVAGHHGGLPDGGGRF